MTKDLENRRAAKRCYNLQLKILASKKWKRMVERIELQDGGKADDLYPCEIIVWKRKYKNFWAYAYRNRIVVYDGFYKKATEKELKQTLAHEMVHSFLMQNGTHDHHGEYFRTACFLLGLNRHHKERAYKYIGRCSECNHRYRKQSYAYSGQYCPECKKHTRTKNRRSKAKLKVRKECQRIQPDVSSSDVGMMESIPPTESTIAPTISMRSNDR